MQADRGGVAYPWRSSQHRQSLRDMRASTSGQWRETHHSRAGFIRWISSVDIPSQTTTGGIPAGTRRLAFTPRYSRMRRLIGSTL